VKQSYFVGLDVDTIAAVLEISPRTAARGKAQRHDWSLRHQGSRSLRRLQLSNSNTNVTNSRNNVTNMRRRKLKPQIDSRNSEATKPESCDV
jgi:hypothetical protein